MKRRGFFQSLARAAAIVALAPQLAFRTRPDLPNVSEPNPLWEEVPYEVSIVTFVRTRDSKTGELLKKADEFTVPVRVGVPTPKEGQTCKSFTGIH